MALVFEVDDFDDAIAELRARGVNFTCETDERTGLRTAQMRAPDGLMHTLVEPPHVSADH